VSVVVFAAGNPNSCFPGGLQRGTAAVAGSGVLTIVALTLVTLDPTALCALPPLVLAVLLALRHYPGEGILVGLSGERRERRERPLASVPFAGRERAVPRGGLLLACALAVRPPPRCSRSASLTIA
jgi:hypothetical protein